LTGTPSERLGLVDQHDRDSVPDLVAQLAGSAFERGAVAFNESQMSLATRTPEQLEQFR